MTNNDETAEKTADCSRSSVGQSIGFLIGLCGTEKGDSESETGVKGQTEANQNDQYNRAVVLSQPGPKFLIGHPTYLEHEETGCWIWQRAKDKDGYGRYRVAKKWKSAHRYYYQRLVGPIPTGTELDHICRNPSCVNPAHLEPVSHTVNARRGRGSKINIQVARRIRRAKGINADIARRFSVNPVTVRLIKLNKIWKEVA